MRSVNVQYIYGAGPDALLAGAMRSNYAQVRAAFPDKTQVYMPRIIDWTEYDEAYRLAQKWKDPIIYVAHSCGCWTAAEIAGRMSMTEKFPYIAFIAPSRSTPCRPRAITPNVERCTEFNSNWFDIFNMGVGQLIAPTPTNDKTKYDRVYTNALHLTAPADSDVVPRVIAEIRRAIA